MQSGTSSSVMPLSGLRRRPVCHGCGQPPPKTLKKPVREFQCQCGYDNYYDEKGNLIDPPIQVTAPSQAAAPSVQYAHQIPRAASPSQRPDSLFCDTCLKNQHFYTEALANYLPPPDDPSYQIYAAAYPDFKEEKNKQFPQICGECLPRAQKRLKENTYNAETDNLRRKILKSKQGIPLTYGHFSSWRGLFYLAAGFAWWSSTITQIIWHGLGMAVDIPMGSDESVSRFACAQLAWKHESLLPWLCFQDFVPLVWTSILVGCTCFWWHHALLKRMWSTKGRLTGQTRHLQIQFSTLTFRVAVYMLLQTRRFFSPPAFRGFHAIAMLLLLFLMSWSIVVVKIDNAPRFRFQDIPAPVSPPPQQKSVLGASPQAYQPSPQRVQPFPIENLATTGSEGLFAEISAHAAIDDDSSPEPDTRGGAEEMDWTPTRRESMGFRPSAQPKANNLFGQPSQGSSASFNQNSQLQNNPSPFFGTLPAAPRPPAYLAVNPPQRRTFQQTPPTKQQNFFRNLMLSGKQRSSSDNTSAGPARSTSDKEFALQPQKFQLKEDPIETGLEYLFDTAFTVRDEPPEVRAMMEQRVRRMDWAAMVGTVLKWASPLIVGLAVAYALSTRPEAGRLFGRPVGLVLGEGVGTGSDDSFAYGGGVDS